MQVCLQLGRIHLQANLHEALSTFEETAAEALVVERVTAPGIYRVYGILLHAGQIGMSDPQYGRYKAFFWVGVAYFLFAYSTRTESE